MSSIQPEDVMGVLEILRTNDEANYALEDLIKRTMTESSDMTSGSTEVGKEESVDMPGGSEPLLGENPEGYESLGDEDSAEARKTRKHHRKQKKQTKKHHKVNKKHTQRKHKGKKNKTHSKRR